MENWVKCDSKKYYIIPKKMFWLGICLVVVIMAVLVFCTIPKATNSKKETYRYEHEQMLSKLEDETKCYLCGLNDDSLMGYYRKFDSIGVIGLNEWHITDLRIRQFDDDGKEIVDNRSSGTTIGNSQGVTYKVDANPSRGMSRATFSSDDKFDSTVIGENLCQSCLDKVTATLQTYKVSDKEPFIPFVLVDFQTLEVYGMQKEKIGYMIRDYWVSLEYDENNISVEAFYLPSR